MPHQTLSSFLVEQIDADREHWTGAHDAASDSDAFEDQLRRGIRWFKVIRMSDEAWSQNVQRGDAPFDPDRARQLDAEYREWIKPCYRMLAKLAEFEQYCPMSTAEEFRECVRTARSLLLIDLERIIEGKADIGFGRTVTLRSKYHRRRRPAGT